MRYLSIGYNMICISPLLSLFLFFAFSSVVEEFLGAFAVNALVISVQVGSIILYFTGYLRREYVGMELYRKHPFIQLVGILLILWGILAALYIKLSFSLYEQHLEESFLTPQPLSFWDMMWYASGVLKGGIWAASGFTLIITSLIQTRTLFPTFPD